MSREGMRREGGASLRSKVVWVGGVVVGGEGGASLRGEVRGVVAWVGGGERERFWRDKYV